MKPSQIAMLEDLGKCWMATDRDREDDGWLSQGAIFNAKLTKQDAALLRRLWNKYQPQIRHNRKVKK